MNRFNEESACDLGRNYTNYMRTMIWGDEPAAPYKVACYGCGEDFEEDQLTPVNDGTPRPLLLCATCLAEETAAAELVRNAAPQLLAALKSIIRNADCLGAGTTAEEIYAAYDAARAAIALAEGSGPEPECTCRMDADMADASCCEAHNPTNYREVA